MAQPFGAGFQEDPYGVYARLRAEGSVHRVALPDGAPVWLVTHEADVRAGLADARFSVDKRHARGGFQGFSLPPALDANLLNVGPEDHLRLRRLVAQGFTPRHVEGMRTAVRAAVDAFADRLVARVESDGVADVVAEFAGPLPLKVIGDLLGVPQEAYGRFAGWIATMLVPGSREELAGAVREVHRFLVELVAARDGGDRLSEDELVSLAFLILMAGSETVQHLISGGLLTLLTHEEELEALRERPGLLPEAVEELFRYAVPNHSAIRRFPTEPVEIGGVRIPAGDTVLFSLAAAHRDPARYPEPDRFDIGRADKAHLALGHGVHYCLGAPLARMQVTLALEALLRRLPGLRLAVPAAELRWSTTFRFRALRALPVTGAVTPPSGRAVPR
ncbi:cytochrome P450 family protein [Streptomyces sp. NPDC001272]